MWPALPSQRLHRDSSRNYSETPVSFRHGLCSMYLLVLGDNLSCVQNPWRREIIVLAEKLFHVENIQQQAALQALDLEWKKTTSHFIVYVCTQYLLVAKTNTPHYLDVLCQASMYYWSKTVCRHFRIFPSKKKCYIFMAAYLYKWVTNSSQKTFQLNWCCIYLITCCEISLYNFNCIQHF